MWGPSEFYDDLEHSIFKIMVAELMASQNCLGTGMLGYSTNHCDESFFVTKFARK
jgi:hypothetical protein